MGKRRKTDRILSQIEKSLVILPDDRKKINKAFAAFPDVCEAVPFVCEVHNKQWTQDDIDDYNRRVNNYKEMTDGGHRIVIGYDPQGKPVYLY